jgi:hypothetical protein
MALASRTGGFPVVETDDLLGGMKKVSTEVNEYYLLGYVPPSASHDGRYHKIHVKVDRPGAEVRARDGYSETRNPDLLAGKPEGMALEAQATNPEAGEIPLTLSAPYFYVKPGLARVNLALSIPGSAIEFEKEKDNFHAQVNILGIAYRHDGSAAARFSDSVNLDYPKDEMPGVAKTAYDYQNSLEIAPGEYTLKLVLSAGGAKFGKYAAPLAVEPFSSEQFTLSGPALGEKVVPSPLGSADIDVGLIEGSAPMVAGGMQLIPSSNNRFKANSRLVVYVEVYDPLLKSNILPLGVLFDLVNRTTNQPVYSSNTIPLSAYIHTGNPLVPVILQLPLNLPAGDYLIKIRGRDAAGNASSVRTGNFSIE